MSEFEPRILGYLCNWCSYAGADLAGVSRYQYPPNLRVIRVMCSTRIDMKIVLHAFMAGADGVFIGGCHIGDCHYISGNFYTLRREGTIRRLLHEARIEDERFRLEWVSASEGERFAKVITEFTEAVRAQGPLFPPTMPSDEREKLQARLRGALGAAEAYRLRAVAAKERELVEDGNIYGEKKDQADLDALLDRTVKDEYLRHRILLETLNGPISVKQMAEHIEEDAQTVAWHVNVLRRDGLIGMSCIEGHSPMYISLIPSGGGASD